MTFIGAQEEVPVTELSDALRAVDRERLDRLFELPMLNAEGDLLDSLPELFLNVLEAGGNVAARKLAKLSKERIRVAKAFTAFDRKNPQAVAWAARHSAEMVVEITENTRLSLRMMTTLSINEGIPPYEAAKTIRKMVGLTSRDARAVINLRKKMLASPGRLIYAGKVPVRVPRSGATAEQIASVTSRYAERLLRQRAFTIARHETMTAANEGQVQLWEQAVSRGELRRTVRRVLIVTPDERLCPICGPLNGQERGIREPFDAGELPFHVKCRCTQGLVTTEQRIAA
jgi:hypothetical protein